MVRLAVPMIAAALACAAYANALDNPFVYDDHDTVTGNRSLVDLSNLRFILVYTPFRPLVNASYALDRWLWSYRPFGYHLTNVVLHAAVVVLLYAWIRRFLSDAGADGDSRLPAFAAAALFAVHPLQSEAVAYMSGRSEVLCAVWFIGALLAARAACLSRSVLQATLAVGVRASRARVEGDRASPARWCFCCTTGCFGRAPMNIDRNGSR